MKDENVAEYCDAVVDAETVNRTFERKFLCQYLGIGESTLSGWLKADRIPLMAKVAIAFLPAMDRLREEINRLRDEAADLKILKNGNVYQICSFREDEDGLVVGRVVADGIQNLAQARLMSVPIKSMKLLARAQPIILHELESGRDYDEEYYLELRDLANSIASQNNFVYNYEKYQKIWSKNARKNVLDELDAELDASIKAHDLKEEVGQNKSKDIEKSELDSEDGGIT